MIVPGVAKAVEEVRCTFDECAVEADPDGSGGAVVVVSGIPMGSPYVQAKVWIGFHITFQYPYADVYPHFTNADLARSDGVGLGGRFRYGDVSRPAGYPGLAPLEQAEPRDEHGGVEVAEGHPLDEEDNMKPWRLTIPVWLYAALQRHLFPGDGDEHGAVILAGTCESDRGLRLVAREIHLAKDGVDYVPGSVAIAC